MAAIEVEPGWGNNTSRFLLRQIIPGKNVARIVLALALGFASITAATIGTRPTAQTPATTIPESLWRRHLGPKPA